MGRRIHETLSWQQSLHARVGHFSDGEYATERFPLAREAEAPFLSSFKVLSAVLQTFTREDGPREAPSVLHPTPTP